MNTLYHLVPLTAIISITLQQTHQRNAEPIQQIQRGVSLFSLTPRAMHENNT